MPDDHGVGRGRLAGCALLLAASCYAPTPRPGLPCGPRDACPDGLVCAPATGTCELDATATPDAPGGGDDARGWPDGSTADAGPPDAASLGEFGPLDPIGAPNDATVLDEDPALSADGLTLVFVSHDRLGGSGGSDLFTARRADRSAPWGPATALEGLNTEFGDEGCPDLSPDGLTLYFVRDGAVEVAVRSTIDSAFTTSIPVPALSAGSSVDCIGISGDGESAIIAAYAPATIRLFRTTALDAGGWSPPVQLDLGLDSERGPWLSPDGLGLVFHALSAGESDIYRTTRPTIDDDFAPPTRWDELSSAEREADPCLTPDLRVVMLSRGSGVDAQLVEAQR